MGRILFLLPLFTLISCASILSGTHENIAVNSSPSGADAALTCSPLAVQRGVTPLSISIPRKSGDCTLTVSKEGYAEQTIDIKQGINGKYWINFAWSPLVPTGLVGIIGWYGDPTASDKELGAAMLLVAAAAFSIDRFTGAIHEHSPKTIDVALKPK
jgi:hypothetical protein